VRLYDEKRDPIINDLGEWKAINVFIEKIKTGILKKVKNVWRRGYLKI
jgi:hypothetical protein